ncbi:GNAT family N-acetyltransferase [Streptomyces sp. NPDC001288]
MEARDDHLFLDSIAVHPGAWGQGVGRRLLPAEEAGQWLKKNQARDQHQLGRQRRAR